jgi:hypothetical protein
LRRATRQAGTAGRHAWLAAALVLASSSASAQGEYRAPTKANADEIAIGFVAGRYITPVKCKRTDGSEVVLEDSVQLKSAPEAGGGNALRATFFGIEVADAEYCYSAIERRVLDRRGSILLHFRARNRPDMGMADFRRAALSGPLTYNAHRGELRVRGIGADAAPQNVLSFEGGDARMVVEPVSDGTDGAKLVTQFLAERPPRANEPQRRLFSFRFHPREGEPFTFIAIEDDRRWRARGDQPPR